MASISSKRLRTIFAVVIALFSIAAFALVVGKDSKPTDSTVALTSSEVDFLTMMIPHHQQAIEMSELALTKSNDDEVIKLAEQIRDAQGPEIEQMGSLLKEFGIEEDPSSHVAASAGRTGSSLRRSSCRTARAAAARRFRCARSCPAARPIPSRSFP